MPPTCMSAAVESRHRRHCDHLPCPLLVTISVNHTCPPQLNPAIIATAVVYLVILTLLAVLSFARSFVEAAHDATGKACPPPPLSLDTVGPMCCTRPTFAALVALKTPFKWVRPRRLGGSVGALITLMRPVLGYSCCARRHLAELE